MLGLRQRRCSGCNGGDQHFAAVVREETNTTWESSQNCQIFRLFWSAAIPAGNVYALGSYGLTDATVDARWKTAPRPRCTHLGIPWKQHGPHPVSLESVFVCAASAEAMTTAIDEEQCQGLQRACAGVGLYLSLLFRTCATQTRPSTHTDVAVDVNHFQAQLQVQVCAFGLQAVTCSSAVCCDSTFLGFFRCTFLGLNVGKNLPSFHVQALDLSLVLF